MWEGPGKELKRKNVQRKAIGHVSHNQSAGGRGGVRSTLVGDRLEKWSPALGKIAVSVEMEKKRRYRGRQDVGKDRERGTLNDADPYYSRSRKICGEGKKVVGGTNACNIALERLR